MLEELASSSPLARRMVTAGHEGLSAMIPSAGVSGLGEVPRLPRRRQRANRRKIAAFFTAASMAALSWCRQGGATNSAPRPIPETSWIRSDLLRRWTEASRMNPFSLEGDKRGRMKDFIAALLPDAASYRECPMCEPLAFISYRGGKKAWQRGLSESPASQARFDYDGPAPSSSSTVQPFLASRLALPARAALIPIDDWLHEDTRLLWNNPAAPEYPAEVVRGFFPVSMAEWRASTRKMMRAGLATQLASNARDPALAAGAFAVRKDMKRDRLIADRRPENGRESQVGLCLLPYGPRLRRVQLKPNEYIRASVQDLSNMYYMFKVSPERLHRQVVGPRVPRSWFDNIEDESFDYVDAGTAPDDWHWSDLRRPGPFARPWSGSTGEVPGMCQVALTAALMGDMNAVTACQQAHRRTLLASGGLKQDELLLPGRPFPAGALFGDTYIDDLGVFLILQFSARGQQEDERRLASIFAKYQELGFERNEKGVLLEAETVDVWGAELRGFRGTVGYGLQKRCTLSAATLMACCLGVTGKELSQLLGTWTYACSYRREALATLDVAFLAARRLPQHRKTRPAGALLDELVALIGLMPLLESDLRARPYPFLLASDASESGLGGCAAPVSAEAWQALYRLAEERGCHVRLDWGDSHVAKLVDNRSAACGLALSAEWSVTMEAPVKKDKHINLLELEAVHDMIFRLARSGLRRSRVLMLVDSQVTLGAVSKGRSSSRRVNFWLRKIAGVCLSYGLTVDLVWVPTKANPADAPSRQVSLDQWWAEVAELQQSTDVKPPEAPLPASQATDKATREVVLLAPPYPSASLPEPPAAPTSSAADQLAATRPVRGRHADENNINGDIPNIINSNFNDNIPNNINNIKVNNIKMNNHASTVSTPLVRSCTAQPHVWELFCGKGSLTAQLTRAGLRTLSGVDLVEGPWKWNLADEGILRRVFKLIRDKNIQYVHLGTPCSSFSMALRGAARTRTTENILGDPNLPRDVVANTLVRTTVRIIKYMERLGRYWSLENPLSSLMWKFPGVRELRSSRLFVKLDQCVYGAVIPNEGPCRKSTAILTNFAALGGLHARCQCTAPHVQLQGSFKHDGRWTSRTKFAGRYPDALSSRWAELIKKNLAEDPLRAQAPGSRGGPTKGPSDLPVAELTPQQRGPRRQRKKQYPADLEEDRTPSLNRAFANWKRLFLLISGDVEPHPGPRASRRRNPACHPLTTGEVTGNTALIYTKAFAEFNTFVAAVETGGLPGVLSREGGHGVSQWLARFLKMRFDRRRRSKVGKAGHFVSAVRRWLLLSASLGVPIPNLTETLRPARRMLRVWELLTPSSFRKPVTREIALSLATAALVQERIRVCVMVLLSFHGLLRPAEARAVKWSDIGFLDEQQDFYPGTYGVIGIALPKTRRMSSHAVHQYVTVESPVLASFLRRVISQVPCSLQHEPIWPGSKYNLRKWWLQTLCSLGLQDSGLTWAGLRAGGATDHWLRNKNLPALRRRGRWSSEKTLERYVQESVFIQCTQKLPARVSETLRRLGELSGTLLQGLPESFLTLERVDVVNSAAADRESSSSESSDCP